MCFDEYVLPVGHATSPDCRMHSCAANGDGGVGTQTCGPPHPPPTLDGWQARAVSAHADAGMVVVGFAVHVPFSGVASWTRADMASVHPVATQNPWVE